MGIIRVTRKITVITSAALFCIALTQKAYCHETCADSLAVLLNGWMGVFNGGANLAWLANPLLLFSWISIAKGKGFSVPISLLAAFTCGSFLFFSKVADNASGLAHQITGYGAGYWFWFSSAISCVVGSYTIFIMRKIYQD